jgi:hypothetical protein
MIKTNGKHIGINANPETDYDFVLANMKSPSRKLVRGLDFYNYVMSLPDTDFKADITNHSGKVVGYSYTWTFRERYPSNLYYCTATNKYVTTALYSFTEIDAGFKKLYSYKKTTTKKSYRIVYIDLSNAQGYKYVCIFSVYKLNLLTTYEESLQLSHNLRYDTTYYPNINMSNMYIKSYEIKKYEPVTFLCETSDEYETYVIATNNDIGMLKAFNTAVNINTYETVGNKVLSVDEFFITV